MSWTAPPAAETVARMDESGKSEDRVWRRFWTGVGFVAAFVILSALLIGAIGGVRVGSGYFLAALIVTLVASTIDATVVRRRSR